MRPTNTGVFSGRMFPWCSGGCSGSPGARNRHGGMWGPVGVVGVVGLGPASMVGRKLAGRS